MIESPVRPIIATLGVTLLVACSDGDSNNGGVTPTPEPTYPAEIVWTE